MSRKDAFEHFPLGLFHQCVDWFEKHPHLCGKVQEMLIIMHTITLLEP